MKILIITDEGFENGGVSTYIKLVKKGLEEKNHTVKILSSNIYEGNQHFNDYAFKGVSGKGSLSWYLNKIFNTSAFTKTKEILEDFKPDVVHVNYIDSQTSPSIFYAIKNTPIAMTLHDYSLISPMGRNDKSHITFKENYGSVKGFIYEKLRHVVLDNAIKHVNLFISPSRDMELYFAKKGFNNIKTILNGIKLLRYSEIKHYNNLLYIGRLSKEKGIEYLLKALPEVIRSQPKTHLSIVGEGNEREHLEKLAHELKIEDNITFVGQVSNEEIQKYYEDATIVVVPSISQESFCLVGVEAMSCGRPVIASNIGAIPEWLENNKTGLLVQPEDSKDLTEKINMLLNDKSLLKEMSRNARDKSKKFSINQYIETLEKTFISLMNIHDKPQDKN